MAAKDSTDTRTNEGNPVFVVNEKATALEKHDELNATLTQAFALTVLASEDGEEHGFNNISLQPRNEYLWALQSLIEKAQAIASALHTPTNAFGR